MIYEFFEINLWLRGNEMSENAITVEFKVESLRKVPNPYLPEEGSGKGPQMYIAICDVRNLPDNIPTKTNPREQNTNTKVAKHIKNSLIGAEPTFYLLNRGILLSADNVSFNSYSKNLTITFSDLSVHGNIDGGHTYKVIKENRNLISDDMKQYVKIEILTGVEDMFQDLADARNTSTQVKDISLINLANKFDPIKTTLASEPFATNISYKENEDGEISISEILAILNMFNIDRYPVMDDRSYPTVSYSSNQTCVKYYSDAFEEYTGEREKENPYIKMKNIMVDIFKLYDHLEMNMANYYKKATGNGKYGSTKGVVTAKDGSSFESKFYKNSMPHQTAKGLIFPVIASLRAIVKEENGVYVWATDPIQMLDNVGPSLLASVVDRNRTLGNNPNAVGKDTQQWKTLHQDVLLQKFKLGLF